MVAITCIDCDPKMYVVCYCVCVMPVPSVQMYTQFVQRIVTLQLRVEKGPSSLAMTLMCIFLAYPRTPLPAQGRGVIDKTTGMPLRFTMTLKGRFLVGVGGVKGSMRAQRHTCLDAVLSNKGQVRQ